ncbi:MAG: FeoA family protein, partial [Eubacteriales bacterium]|nr:FeoA family protein [Eubacteriales bacterium]
PSGDPLCIRIRSYVLSLRRADASLIEVDNLQTAGSYCGDCNACKRNARQERMGKRRRGRRSGRRGNF